MVNTQVLLNKIAYKEKTEPGEENHKVWCHEPWKGNFKEKGNVNKIQGSNKQTKRINSVIIYWFPPLKCKGRSLSYLIETTEKLVKKG